MMASRLLGGDFIGGEMVWWQDDHNMLSLTVYGHLTTELISTTTKLPPRSRLAINE